MSSPKIIDSHAHLNFSDFDTDRDAILDDTLDSGTWVINVGSNFETSRKAVEIAQRYSQGVYAAVGIHPIHVLDEGSSREAILDLIQNNENVVAIGEIGLDYFHLESEKGKLKANEEDAQFVAVVKKKQQTLLAQQLELVRAVNLPVIFHCRHYKNYDAHYDMLKVIEKFATLYQNFKLQGVVHCYTGNLQLAEIYLRLGLYLGFTGVITFSDDYNEIIKKTPLERILIETDSPYLSPEPKRGKRNVPENVKYVAEKIAKIKGIKVSEVRSQTVKNTKELFGLGN
ncbi:MAG: TatD family hydrolase [Patescibacteria group bacterium]|nr:TatD family hydrolase [Patescibacteria group bacterium]